MADIPQFQARVYLDNAGGSLQELADTADCKLSIDNGVVDNSRINNRFSEFNDGKLSWSVQMSLYIVIGASNYAMATDWALAGGKRTIRMDTPDSAAGSIRWEGECLLRNAGDVLSAVATSGDSAKMTLSLQGSGTLTKSTIV